MSFADFLTCFFCVFLSVKMILCSKPPNTNTGMSKTTFSSVVIWFEFGNNLNLKLVKAFFEFSLCFSLYRMYGLYSKHRKSILAHSFMNDHSIR